MFQISTLINSICRGEGSFVTVNGRRLKFSSAKSFSCGKNGCSGTFGNLSFELKKRDAKPYSVFSLALSNKGKQAVRIGDITLFTHSEQMSGKHLSRNVFAFQDSLFSNNFVERAVDKKGIHKSLPLCLIYDLPAKKSFFSAQLTFDKNDVVYEMKFDPGNGRLKLLSCVMPVMDFQLEPGKKVVTDEVVVSLRTDRHPGEELYAWADKVHEILHPDIPENIPAGFLAGWLISTKAEKTDSQIRRNIAAGAALKKLGLEYVWTSIDNLPDGMPGNWLESNRENFHDGVPEFLREIRKAGFKPGLWIAPYVITEQSKDFEKVKDFLTRDKDGNLLPWGRWPWGPLDEKGNRPQTYTLDPEKKEARDYIGSIFRTYTHDWGVRYFMADFLDAGIHGENAAFKSFARESYRAFLRGIRKHTAPGTYFLSATGTSTSMIGFSDSSRIGLDYGEARQLDPVFASYPANYIINGSFGSSGAPNRNAIQNLAMWGFAHNRFFQCNSNVMTVDKPVPLSEAMISATMFGISPSPVFFQDDFQRMSPDRYALLKKVLPRCPGMPEAADLFTKTDADRDFLRIFRLPISKKWGEWTVCAVFNLNDDFRKVTLDAGLLGLEKETDYRMYDFWDECYMGTFRKERAVEMPGMSCKVYRFAKKTDHPWVLSTDFHVRQGDAELADVRWDAKKNTLSGTVKRAKGERGNIFLISPDTWMESHFNKGMLVAKSALDHALIIKLPIVFNHDEESWKVEFTPIDSPRKKKHVTM